MSDNVLRKLLGIKIPSKHCNGKQETLIAYDHTGYTKWKCDCGHTSEWRKHP